MDVDGYTFMCYVVLSFSLETWHVLFRTVSTAMNKNWINPRSRGIWKNSFPLSDYEGIQETFFTSRNRFFIFE